MTIEEQVKNTPLEERPLINDAPGQSAHPMDDERYAEYLRMQEDLAKIPPSPDPIQEQIEELQAAVIELAAMQTGGA